MYQFQLFNYIALEQTDRKNSTLWKTGLRRHEGLLRDIYENTDGCGWSKEIVFRGKK
jgi:hypothetical protein